MLTEDQVDAVFATYSITPARAEVISFAGPYYTSRQGVLVKADWYSQIQDGPSYIIRTKDTINTGFENLTPGRAWFANAYSGEDGIVLLHYTVPSWTVAAGEEGQGLEAKTLPI